MDGLASCKICAREEPRRLDLIVTDGHEGVLAAVSELFSATPRQRCLVHKQRNVLNAIPRRERGDIQVELLGIWNQSTKQEALTHLAAFKAKYGQRLELIQKNVDAKVGCQWIGASFTLF